MIGIVLVTHGGLAAELIAVAEHVVGPQRMMEAIGIAVQDDLEAKRAEIEAVIARCDEGDGVVILTDMFGGTPSNLAISAMRRDGIEVIAGVNLPMLVKLAKIRGSVPLGDAITCAETAGRKYIAAASHVFNGVNMPVKTGTDG